MFNNYSFVCVCGEMDITTVTEEMVLGSVSPIKKKQKTEYAPLAQLDRASVYGTEGRAFESPMAHHQIPILKGILAILTVARFFVLITKL